MRVLRALLAVVAVVAVVAAVVALTEAPGAGEAGSYAVKVVGPDGPLWNGTVGVSDATPLSLLEAAAQAGGFALDVQGSGCDAYVRAVAGHAAEGQAGWLFEVKDDPDGDGVPTWRHPLRSAGCVPLSEGDEVRWMWSDDGVY